MRDNPIKAKLEAGETVFGTFVSLPEPGIVEIIGAAGYDFVVIDLEHTPINVGRMRDLLSAADGAGLTPLVRVGTCDANPILRVLDAGAFGVVAPHVCGPEEARDLVRACRYPPQGVRGVSGASRAAGYGRSPFGEHVVRSNQEILTIALIEDRSGVETIDEIAGVEGLDVIFPGPGDLSASLGYIGQMKHPEVVEAVSKIAQVVHSRPGMVLGYQIMDPADMERCIELGAQLIILSQDTRVFYQAYRKGLQALRKSL
jgi:4-hydroxy-2-oxoheptanedioate aldolase